MDNKTLHLAIKIALVFTLTLIGISLVAQVKSTTPYEMKSPLGKLFHEYKVTQTKALGWGLCVIGGVAWGVHEAKYADAKILEKRFGLNPYKWGGSQDWQTKYPGGRYEKGENPDWFRDKTNVFRESKKTTAFLGRYLPISAGICITLDKHKNWKDYVIGTLLYSTSATLTYSYLRWGRTYQG